MEADETTKITGVEAFVTTDPGGSSQRKRFSSQSWVDKVTRVTRMNSSIEIPPDLESDEPFVRELVPPHSKDDTANARCDLDHCESRMGKEISGSEVATPAVPPTKPEETSQQGLVKARYVGFDRLSDDGSTARQEELPKRVSGASTIDDEDASNEVK